MGFFNRYSREGKGVTKEDVEAEGAPKRFFAEFGHRFWQLIVLNLLYVLACVPIVTIGPATAALNYVCRNFSQAKPVDFFTDFIEKCKEHFKRGFFAFLIQALLAVMLWYSFQMWTAEEFAVATAWKTAASVLIFFVAYLLISSSFYLYPMMVSFDLPLRQLIRNSVILALTKLWRNLAMILFSAVLIIATLLFWPVSFPLPLFFAFSFASYFNNAFVFPVLVRHVAATEPPPEPTEE